MNMKTQLLTLFILFSAMCSEAQVFIPGADSTQTSVPSDDEIIMMNTGYDTLALNKGVLEILALKDLEQEAQRKVDFLSKYISQIATKDAEVTRDQKRSAINQALKLFLDEKRVIEVSSVNSDNVEPYPVRTYLEHLMLLPYTTVSVKWSNVYIAKDLIMVSDNPLIYEGVISVVQTFKGCYKENQSCYQDVTYKNILIRVEAEQVFNGENEETVFVVKLGDTSVTETR